MMLSSKSNRTSQNLTNARPNQDVVCSWCRAVIRSNAEETQEQMCLICHARMLNDYFQRLRKVSDERRTARRF